MSITWPTDLTKLMKRISTPAEEVFKGLDLLGDYNKENIDAGHATIEVNRAAMEARLLIEWAGKFATKRYYVSVETGSDSNDGLTLATAFATIKKAVNECKATTPYGANKLDYVFIAPGLYPEGDIYQEGHGTHLIGLGLRGADSGVRIIPDSDPTHCILALQAAHCEVANIYFYSGYTDPCIWSPNHLDNSWIHHCTLAGLYTATTDCLKMLNTRDTIIEHNLIHGFKENGIKCYNEADAYLINTIMRKNLIGGAWNGLGSGCKGIFIDSDVLVYNSEIHENHVNLSGAAGAPIGIDNDAPTRDGGLFITDNYVMVPTGGTPITSVMTAHGILHNHTLDGSTVADPNTAV